MTNSCVRILLVLLLCSTELSQIMSADSKKDPVALLKSDLNRIFSDWRLAQAQIGVAVFSLDRSETLYARNSRQLYIPASCNKLVTAATALTRLGPDYRFDTQVLTDGRVEDGELKGNLIVVGSGDPTNSARFQAGDRFGVFRNWAAILREMEIGKITGDLVGHAGAFHDPKYGLGWEWEDLRHSYAAPISALQFNENMIELLITPAIEPGGPAALNLSPLPGYLTLENKVQTVPGTGAEISVEPDESGDVLAVRGMIPLRSPVVSKNLAVRRPTHYYLSALKSVLAQEGIETEECGLREVKSYADAATLLWVHKSPALSEILEPLLKESLNLHAETLVRTLGLAFRKEGSFTKGKEVVEETLERMGIEKEGYRYADGSGLSRLNLQSPETLVRILAFMRRSRDFRHFYNALPVAGLHGTLAGRMKQSSAAGKVHAKTGTISGVSAISGYVETAGKELLAFSIILNNYTGSKAAAETVQDRALERLANFSRK